LTHDDKQSADQLIQTSIAGGCTSIVIPEGEWRLQQAVLLAEQSEPVTIRGRGPASILSGRSPLITIRRGNNLAFENLTVEGVIELEQTENIRFSAVTFRRGGLHFPGRKCNQPNECTIFNRRIVVENCVFQNCTRGIRAERLENSRIADNRFIGSPASCTNESIGIDLDGSSEDLDRPLELGHSKGNQILQNSFEQEASIGIRIRDSWGNILRENAFVRVYRAIELYDGARHNQGL
jgi:hypothetical protein